MPHPAFTLLAAVLLSAALAFAGDRPPGERFHAAVYMFLCCVITTVAGSWIMYAIHG